MQQEFIYLAVAYAIAWIGLFAYLAFIVMRMRNVQTEFGAVSELVREYQEQKTSRSASGGSAPALTEKE